MATKKRLTDGGALIEFEHVEMLKLERLLKILGNDANEWPSNALDLFAPELPPREYPI